MKFYSGGGFFLGGAADECKIAAIEVRADVIYVAKNRDDISGFLGEDRGAGPDIQSVCPVLMNTLTGR